MRYHDSQLLQRLAAEYVLGTLHGRARRRFEQLMTDSHQVRSAVWHWERQFSPLARSTGSMQPRPHVWREVMKRTGGEAESKVETVPWYERLGLWRGFSLAATAAALVLAVMLTMRPTEVAAPQYVAIVNGEQSQPLWLIRADIRSGRLNVRAINASAPAAENSYELWVLPGGGAPPRSLGLLPTGGGATDTALPSALASVLGSAQGLAVSLEPRGGSPTGLPTGPVVYQAPIVTI
jgi:anti-sigma-K factor RskA